MIKRRLSKRARRNAKDRPTTFERALKEHHGSVQVLPGVNGEFVKVKGEPGKRQTLKWWRSDGVRKQEWTHFGTQEFRAIGSDKPIKVNRGEKRKWYGPKGEFQAKYVEKRIARQPIIPIEAEMGASGGGLIVGKPFIKEKQSSKSRVLGNSRKSKRTRRIQLKK